MKLQPLSPDPESLTASSTPTESHTALMRSVEPHYQEFAIQQRDLLIQEYKCATPSDKTLCELAAGALSRHASATQKLQYLRDEYWSTKNHRTRTGGSRYQKQEEESTNVRDHLRRIEIESKEVDRSLRQYQSIIAQLSQRNSPMPEVHIKAAFVAQSQQFNLRENYEAN